VLHTRPETWFRIADAVARLKSNCSRSRVGAVVASADGLSLLSVGYNSTAEHCPRGSLSYAELPQVSPFEGAGQCTAVHAEVAAVRKAGGWENLRGATVYVTREPCSACWEFLESTPVAGVVWPSGRRALDVRPVR
jgi:dCMP deaminase